MGGLDCSLVADLTCMLGLALSELSEKGPYSRTVKIIGKANWSHHTLHTKNNPYVQGGLYEEHVSSHMAIK